MAGLRSVITRAGLAIALAGAGVTSALAGSVSISDQTVSQYGLRFADGGHYRLHSSGVAQALNNLVATTLETWRLGGASSDYEARAAIVSGSVSSALLGHGFSLDTSPEWAVNRTVSGTCRRANITRRNSQCCFALHGSCQCTNHAGCGGLLTCPSFSPRSSPPSLCCKANRISQAIDVALTRIQRKP